jgi:hypothetical protein
MGEALRRALELTASEWRAFAYEMFKDRVFPVPDWPQHVQYTEDHDSIVFSKELHRRDGTYCRINPSILEEIQKIWSNVQQSVDAS